MRLCDRARVALVGVAAVLLLPAVAHAQPPANDNRAAAAAIPTFPATVSGTTVDATVERLDPQVSKCGAVEGTVWYRIDQAPDGTVALAVQGDAIAPVLRVYALTKNALQELTCSAAATAGAAAQVSFETQRGASYLLLVGRRPSTPDGAFQLSARLFLPPANDSPGQAKRLSLGAPLNGSTIGATTDADDPDGCGLVGGTVWYTLSPGKAERIVVRLHASADFDASLVVQRKVRSQVEDIGCGRTNAKGDLVVAWDVEEGATYLLAIGQRQGSPPGDFTLRTTAAQARESAPGALLESGAAHATVNWLSDVNDVYSARLVAGTTYRLVFSSTGGCARLTLGGPFAGGGKQLPQLRSLACSGYTTFTPAPPDGRYVIEVTAPSNAGTVAYRLKLLRAGADDTGVGLELENLVTRRGSLAPSAGDAVDVYHFDVATPSDVRLRLAASSGSGVSLVLLTDAGGRLGASETEIARNLQRGRYVVAVRGTVGERGGRYGLSLVIRQLTRTSLSASASEVGPGAPVTLRVASPPALDGVIELRIDRFDPLDGWQFNRVIRLRAPGGSVGWTPPALGRWRVRADYLGTLRFSPSASGFVNLLVAKPIG